MTETRIINISALAEQLGKVAEQKTLPNGRVIAAINWEGSDLPAIWEALSKGNSKADHIRINGAAPAWLVTAIAHAVHPASVSINSPDGYVPIGCSAGENSRVNVRWNADTSTLTVEAADPSQPFTVTDLASLPLPDLFGQRLVIISGRIPNWMTASIADHYAHLVGAVACFQPGVGSTVAISHNADVALGSLIPA